MSRANDRKTKRLYPSGDTCTKIIQAVMYTGILLPVSMSELKDYFGPEDRLQPISRYFQMTFQYLLDLKKYKTFTTI